MSSAATCLPASSLAARARCPQTPRARTHRRLRHGARDGNFGMRGTGSGRAGAKRRRRCRREALTRKQATWPVDFCGDGLPPTINVHAAAGAAPPSRFNRRGPPAPAGGRDAGARDGAPQRAVGGRRSPRAAATSASPSPPPRRTSPRRATAPRRPPARASGSSCPSRATTRATPAAAPPASSRCGTTRPPARRCAAPSSRPCGPRWPPTTGGALPPGRPHRRRRDRRRRPRGSRSFAGAGAATAARYVGRVAAFAAPWANAWDDADGRPVSLVAHFGGALARWAVR